jgi:hypothetical protein
MATKHGQFLIHGGKADPYVINNEDYKVKVTKTWVPSTNVWHIQFVSDNIYEYTFELFLTKEELEHLKRIL